VKGAWLATARFFYRVARVWTAARGGTGRVRIIAGSARGRKLVVPSGRSVRPTSDRVREALFNILADEVPGCRFLDLYAGSGAVGIEALSRGARQVDFVEQDPTALQVLLLRGSWNVMHSVLLEIVAA